MSRDYKTHKPAKSAPEKRGSAFVGGFIGYALGLASAIGIWLYLNYAPSPFLPAEKTVSPAEKNQSQPAAEAAKTAEKSVPEEPAIIVEEKPRFDFYKILPGIEEPEIDQESRQAAEPSPQSQVTAKVPEVNNKPVEIAPQPAPPRPGVAPAETAPQVAAIPPRTIPAEPVAQPVAPQVTYPPAVKEKFFLQAGSFRRNDEAENLKARLALLGVFASIQPIDLAEKGIWYRVRIGPFSNKADSDQTSAALRENGIETQSIRIQ